MQNREELRQKGHDGSWKTTCRERGKKYHFQKGGGINIVFGPKYRPLGKCERKRKEKDRYKKIKMKIGVRVYIIYTIGGTSRWKECGRRNEDKMVHENDEWRVNIVKSWEVGYSFQNEGAVWPLNRNINGCDRTEREPVSRAALPTVLTVSKAGRQKRWSVKRFIASISLPALNASSLHCFNFLL
jgi:hypothetical protein